MKRLLFICSIAALGSSAFAQEGCSRTLPLFRFEDAGTPEKVYTLGSAPQFTFLRHLSSPAQVVAAAMRAEKDAKYRKGVNELNSLMVEIGFDNGLQDLKQSSVTSETIPSGTIGRMGNSKYIYAYTQLSGTHGFEAWKITSDKGCYVYIMKECGNAFYPEAATREVKPVAMLDSRSYEGNLKPEPPMPEKKEVVEDIPQVRVSHGPEDCYCKFRSMYKAYYPYHSRKENKMRRRYIGDYPRACTTDGSGYCRR